MISKFLQILMIIISFFALSYATEKLALVEEEKDFVSVTFNEYSNNGYVIFGIYQVKNLEKCNLKYVKSSSNKETFIDYCNNLIINIPEHPQVFEVGSLFYIMKSSYDNVILGPIENSLGYLDDSDDINDTSEVGYE